jgi:sulfur carrier protein
MRITVNGQHTEVEAHVELGALLARFDVATDAGGVAVAVNESVVPRGEWPSRRLTDGDVVEIVRAVQGG